MSKDRLEIVDDAEVLSTVLGSLLVDSHFGGLMTAQHTSMVTAKSRTEGINTTSH